MNGRRGTVCETPEENIGRPELAGRISVSFRVEYPPASSRYATTRLLSAPQPSSFHLISLSLSHHPFTIDPILQIELDEPDDQGLFIVHLRPANLLLI
jgi:hypothetical protein